VLGFEREMAGRDAGLRTHMLVATGSALFVLVPLQAGFSQDNMSRVLQGLVSGIGFLGAGVIFKEGLTVRGLTTAASIWTTAAIGILLGIGFWFAAILGAATTLIVLSLFRFVEAWLPSEYYAHHMLRFARDRVMSEADMRKMIEDHGFSIANLSSRLTEAGQHFEYRMTIKSRDRRGAGSLSEHLIRLPEVIEFRIAPTGD